MKGKLKSFLSCTPEVICFDLKAEVDNFLHEVDKVIEEGSLIDDDLISNFPAISFSDILLVYLS